MKNRVISSIVFILLGTFIILTQYKDYVQKIAPPTGGRWSYNDNRLIGQITSYIGSDRVT